MSYASFVKCIDWRDIFRTGNPPTQSTKYMCERYLIGKYLNSFLTSVSSFFSTGRLSRMMSTFPILLPLFHLNNYQGGNNLLFVIPLLFLTYQERQQSRKDKQLSKSKISFNPHWFRRQAIRRPPWTIRYGTLDTRNKILRSHSFASQRPWIRDRICSTCKSADLPLLFAFIFVQPSAQPCTAFLCKPRMQQEYSKLLKIKRASRSQQIVSERLETASIRVIIY